MTFLMKFLIAFAFFSGVGFLLVGLGVEVLSRDWWFAYCGVLLIAVTAPHHFRKDGNS